MPRSEIIIPSPVIRRMTQYLAYVRGKLQHGVEWITSSDIAEDLGLTSSTVRQDLSYVELCGTAKRGYSTCKLVRILNQALGTDKIVNAAIVGAGNLGKALALYGGFERDGFHMSAIFDNDPRLIGMRVGALTVLPMSALKAVVRRENIEIGIIVVPESSAQLILAELVDAGCTGILNMSPAPLKLPRHLPCVDVRMVSCLQELLYGMRLRANVPNSCFRRR